MKNFTKLALAALLCLIAMPLVAFAEAVGDTATATGLPWLGYAIGAGIAIGFASLGCGIGQGILAGNTTAGIARNPGATATMNTPFILGMVLIESIAIYGLVIAFMLMGKY
jgi:F-type H+-transporting ATPase subunit c